MKYTKIVAMLALAASLQAFAQDKISVTIINASKSPVGISVEGTKPGKSKKDPVIPVILDSAMIPAGYMQELVIKNIPSKYFVKNAVVNRKRLGPAYKLKIANLLTPKQQTAFNPLNRKQPYKQRKMLEMSRFANVTFVIAATGAVNEITQLRPSISDLRPAGSGHTVELPEDEESLTVEMFDPKDFSKDLSDF